MYMDFPFECDFISYLCYLIIPSFLASEFGLPSKNKGIIRLSFRHPISLFFPSSHRPTDLGSFTHHRSGYAIGTSILDSR